MKELIRVQVHLSGIVQGVGFRPFVYGLAHKHLLKGHVFNNETGVMIDVEGPRESIDQFISELKSHPPSLARIESVTCSDDLERAHFDEFQIVASAGNKRPLVSISPDVATCADCLRELLDPHDRRFRYPFINCTNCGPRFTIIEDVPYDRAQTTMREFPMCDACRAEYENPLDRRFHAEPTACAACGPQVYLTEKDHPAVSIASGDKAVARTIDLLLSGRIVAIKGIGGFHLGCDALNETAVTALRKRKYREDKPFALMAPTIEVVRRYCSVSESEKELLLSTARPIVLLERNSDRSIPTVIAPNMQTLGFMLPYSPLQYLLFENLDRPLVMTSANISDEPICYTDGDARKRLENIADYYLLHNRRIHMRADDSVARCGPNVLPVNNAPAARATTILRRSRGYAPAPIKTGFKFTHEILACGAELKNTFCLTRDQYAFVSHHIGDLENLETLKSFTEGIGHFKQLLYLEPKVVAYDLHPEYLSTKHALSLDTPETKIGIQHHHAHVASCMADNRIDGEVIGVAMDGLGFGTDGRMWGGEFLVASFSEAERFAHLDYLPMPGGATAIRQPWRMAAIYLQQAFGDDFIELDLPFVKHLDRAKWKTLRKMAATGANSPETSSMGRMFDGVAAMLGLRNIVNYEGQAAIELEQIADRTCRDRYQFEISGSGSIIRAQTVIRAVVEDSLGGVPPSIISAKFHLGVADLIVAMASRIKQDQKLNRVVLSGGVFQNLVLLQAACAGLREAGFEVFTHSRVPANDGGISLGQAAIANAVLRNKDRHRPVGFET
jgi:hydrogenase maturation protein HypF